MLNKLTAAVCAYVVAAVGCQAGRARGEPEAGGARPARVGGALMPSVYRFFRTFVIMSVWLPGGVLVCGMGMSDRCYDTWTVTFYGPLSWRVSRTRREGCLRVGARASTEEGNLSLVQLVYTSRQGRTFGASFVAP